MCYKCGNLVRDIFINKVKEPGPAQNEQTVIDLNKQEQKKEKWVGPIYKQCTFCKGTRFYFLILPPPSPDQPNIVKHRCESCRKITSEYKN
jgi:DNA-directed RNA polymerase subunit M/transcription elongation factor TFIIS